VSHTSCRAAWNHCRGFVSRDGCVRAATASPDRRARGTAEYSSIPLCYHVAKPYARTDRTGTGRTGTHAERGREFTHRIIYKCIGEATAGGERPPPPLAARAHYRAPCARTDPSCADPAPSVVCASACDSGFPLRENHLTPVTAKLCTVQRSTAPHASPAVPIPGEPPNARSSHVATRIPPSHFIIPERSCHSLRAYAADYSSSRPNPPSSTPCHIMLSVATISKSRQSSRS
jgi:hypothetical protein